MGPEKPENGFDERARLSQQFTRQQGERTERERQREEQGKKVRGVLKGLRELNISMAVEQLKPVATPEIIDEVNALKNKTGNEDLRRLITDLADDLEDRIGATSTESQNTATLVNPMRTLNILLNLYFSLQ
jgi:hypothetical protein